MRGIVWTVIRVILVMGMIKRGGANVPSPLAGEGQDEGALSDHPHLSPRIVVRGRLSPVEGEEVKGGDMRL